MFFFKNNKFFLSFLIIFLSIEHLTLYLTLANHWFPQLDLVYYQEIFICTAGVCLISYHALFKKGQHSNQAFLALGTSILLWNLFSVLAVMIKDLSAENQTIYDSLLMGVDKSLGFSPSFSVGTHFLHAPHFFQNFILFIYNVLPLFLIIIPCYDIWNNKPFPIKFYVEFLAISTAGVLLFNIKP